jgi:trans-aconitate 2-methyltransferase
MAAKDFGAIESDYAFFASHATEAAGDAAEYARELAGFVDRRATIRMLDFGCGTGEFTERLLSTLGWPASVLELTLVEPVNHQREQASRRVAKFSGRGVTVAARLAAETGWKFDLILSNHALYYVDDLAASLRQLLGMLAPRGAMVLAIAGWDNLLMQLWKLGFAMLGRPVPYYAADDVEACLSRLPARFRQTRSTYQLRFPDSDENRLKILRFLFADHLTDSLAQALARQFDRYVAGGYVDVTTQSRHFVVETE